MRYTPEQRKTIRTLIIKHGGWWERICVNCGDISFKTLDGGLELNMGDVLRHTKCGGQVIKNIWHTKVPGDKQNCPHCGEKF